jgi:hypothetical protein
MTYIFYINKILYHQYSPLGNNIPTISCLYYMNKYYTMSRFLPVPDSSGFDAKEDVEDASATIREFMASIPIAHVPGPDGLKCYQLNPGTKLYRADTERLQYGIPTGIATDYLPDDGPVFFGFAESSVDQYGIVAEYEVLNPIHSIALDDPDTNPIT